MSFSTKFLFSLCVYVSAVFFWQSELRSQERGLQTRHGDEIMVCGQFYRAAGSGIYAGMAAMALMGCITMLAMRRRVDEAAAANI